VSPDRASSQASRKQIYSAVAIFFFVVAVGTGMIKAWWLGQPLDLVLSDGRYYYAYLPSVVIDGDFDFTNQIREHWGPDFRPELLEARTPTGLVQNKYPIGLALTLTPAFLVGHVIALASDGWISADGYSWPYQLACLAFLEWLVYRTLIRVDRLLTERLGVPSGPVLVGLVTLALGTPYAYYACRQPFMVHVASAFWCTECVGVAAMVRSPRWFWVRLSFCGAMALVCRPTNMHLLPVVLAGVWRIVQTVGWRRTLACLPLACTAIVPIGLQMATWKTLGGRWVYYSYGDEGFDWMHPALWETLVSSRHGLFFWSPILALAIVGLIRIRDAFVWCWMLGGLFLWYANSSWHSWWFGDAFGARAFLELSGLFGAGLAALMAAMTTRGRGGVALASIIFNWVVMVLFIAHVIPHDAYLLP